MPGTDQCRRGLPLPTVWYASAMPTTPSAFGRGLHWNQEICEQANLSGGQRC